MKANPDLGQWLKVKANSIERKDGRGFLEALPAGDIVGQHGKSYPFVGYDEIHGYRSWDVLEAMQPDPHRLDAQQWVTSYASLFHRPGVPLFDLIAQGKGGTDPRMLFSWYAADFTTDTAFADKPPEIRANPSMPSWGDAGYLAQQQRRLVSRANRPRLAHDLIAKVGVDPTRRAYHCRSRRPTFAPSLPRDRTRAPQPPRSTANSRRCGARSGWRCRLVVSCRFPMCRCCKSATPERVSSSPIGSRPSVRRCRPRSAPVVQFAYTEHSSFTKSCS